MATAGKLGAVYAPTETEGEIDTTNTTDTFSGDGTTTTYQLNNEYALRESETVTVDGEETDDYTLNYITGELVFDEAPPDGTDNITVEYDYLDAIEQVAGFFEWSFDEEAGLEESPEFGDEVITHTSTLDSCSGSADMYFGVDDRFSDWVGEEVVLAFYIDDTAGVKQRFEGWGIIGNKSTDTPVDTLVEQSIVIEGQTRLEYREA